MSVLSAYETTERSGQDEADRTLYVQRWVVISNEKNEHQSVILAAEALPKIGEEYPTDEDSKVLRRNAQQSPESPFVWFVDVEWSTEGEDPDPTKRPPIKQWGTIKEQVPATKTVHPFDQPELVGGAFVPKAIVNAAGEPFDPPPMINESRLTLERDRLPTGVRSE